MQQWLRFAGRRLLGASQRHLIWFASVAALVLVAAIAFATDRSVRGQITVESRQDAVRVGQLLAHSSYAPAVARAASSNIPLPRAADGGLPKSVRAELDSATAASIRSSDILGVTVWGRDGRILYASRGHLLGRRFPVEAETRRAFRGVETSRIERSPGSGADFATARIDVNVPIRAGVTGPPVAVLELAVPYAPVTAEIERRAIRLDKIVITAGLLLYLLMVPILIWVGRAVRTQFDPRRTRLVERLRRAIENEQIRLEFQPLVDLRTGAVKSAEALVRWDDPRHGRIPPDDFIPLAEGSAFFWDFTLHVLDLALEECAACRRRGLEISVAVNVSVGNLFDARMPTELRRLLTKHHLPATALELEVTERALMDEGEEAAGALEQLAAIGIGHIAIDDFGRGHSSLARVHSLPIDTVKIDRSFIAEMSATDDTAMVRSVIALAHNLGLIVVAEGIEDHESWGRLARLGCDLGQGYCISRPLPGAAFQAWLESYEPGSLSSADQSERGRRTGPGRRRDDYFAVAFDNAPEAMLIADDAGRWIDANVRACELLKVSRATLRLRRCGSFSPAASRTALGTVWSELRSEGCASGTWTIADDEGTPVSVEFEATASFLPGLHLFVVRRERALLAV
ncbi:MAG: hypothetical protein QOJ29_4902 [Thermoleophilaceae bacterium]|jgi:EAL domain-containing protein (putative c-di-GMP-specific phosphodiesterase class I)|nr:hypothetical protein [Thermoleophilaceae bacterium]